MDKLKELVRLHRMGMEKRAIARVLSMSPSTEQRYRKKLETAGLLRGGPEDLPELDQLVAVCASGAPRPQQERSSVEAWRPQIAALVAKDLQPTAIHQVLAEEDTAFKGSLSAVKRLVLQLACERGARPEDVAIPVETPPGEAAQVDFGYAGYVVDPATGRKRKAWLFVRVQGCSRHMFCKVVFDQSTDTWLRLHVEAFAAFGGVPRVLVPDNLKAAVIRAAFGLDDVVTENRAFRELARHCGFVIDPTPPRSPEKKGKVERSALDAVEVLQRLLAGGPVALGARDVGHPGGHPPIEIVDVDELARIEEGSTRATEHQLIRTETGGSILVSPGGQFRLSLDNSGAPQKHWCTPATS